MDLLEIKRLKSNTNIHQIHENQIFQGYSKRRSESNLSESSSKKVTVIYASGSMGANKDLQIQREQLHNIMSQNFYLCDIEHTKKCYPKLDLLITPLQQTGVRIQYKVVQLERIGSSINMSLEQIADIAKIIFQNYRKCDAFIVVTGLDTICHLGTVLSFMLQNLSKLVICTGGYIPLSRMRNDSVSNLLECFSLVSEASTLNEVLIVLKNKGFRANRCIKMTQGDFQNISSPNLPAICSIKTKIRVRSYLVQPKPELDFSIFTQLSRKIKIIRLNQYQCIESLEYDLKNPYIKGVVIQSYSYANIPNLPQMLNLFKEAYEDKNRRIIFINISEAICSKNDSLMKYYLENYHIYFGADMTCQAALAKLAYLIGKGYPQDHIIKLMQTNLRGELTQEKEQLQFKIKDLSSMQIVNGILKQYFPPAILDFFENKIEKNVSQYIIDNCTAEEFQELFYFSNLDDKENQKRIAELANLHNLLHNSVAFGNIQMAEFFLRLGVNINAQDKEQRSPLFHALKQNNKSMIQMLSKRGGRVISPITDLFQIFVEALKRDEVQFFDLLSHIEFKESLKQIKNSQRRSVAHIAGLLNAEKCFALIQKKFNVSVKQKDIYEKTAIQYMEISRQEARSAK